METVVHAVNQVRQVVHKVPNGLNLDLENRKKVKKIKRRKKKVKVKVSDETVYRLQSLIKMIEIDKD